MLEDFNFPQPNTLATGDYSPQRPIVRLVKFDRYEIEIELSPEGKFIQIASVKVQKDFTESIKYISNPDVHDAEKYYKEE